MPVGTLVVQHGRTYRVTGTVRDQHTGASVEAGHVVAVKLIGRGRNRQVCWRQEGGEIKGRSRVRFFRLNVAED